MARPRIVCAAEEEAALQEAWRAKHLLEMVSRACRVAYKNAEQNDEVTLALTNISSLKCHAVNVSHDTTTILKLNFVSVSDHL